MNFPCLAEALRIDRLIGRNEQGLVLFEYSKGANCIAGESGAFGVTRRCHWDDLRSPALTRSEGPETFPFQCCRDALLSRDLSAHTQLSILHFALPARNAWSRFDP